MSIVLFQSRPRFVADIEPWCRAGGVPLDDGWARFAHALALQCVAADPVFGPRIVLHGGSAACYAHGLPRTPRDLDLMVVVLPGAAGPPERTEDLADAISSILERDVERLCPEIGPHLDRVAQLVQIDVFTERQFTRPASAEFAGVEDVRICVADVHSCVARKYLKIIRRAGRKPWLVARDLFDLAWLLGRYRVAAEDVYRHLAADFDAYRWPPVAEHDGVFRHALAGAADHYAQALARVTGDRIGYEAACATVGGFHGRMVDLIHG